MAVFDAERDRFRTLVAELHLAGVSQRKLDVLCRRLFGTTFTPASTQTATDELLRDEAFQVNEGSLIAAPRTFLFFDGVWMTVRSARTGETTHKVVLVALGMDMAGNKKILGFAEAFAEDEPSWRAFLERLAARGVVWNDVRCVVADDGAGLQAAMERVSPATPIQLCITHRYRNVLKHTPHQHKKAMGQDLRGLTPSPTKASFLAHVRAMEERWQTIAPRAMKSLTQHLDRATTYFQFDQALWTTLRTTNPLERTFREVRRRTVIQDHHFTTPESSDRYHTAIFGKLNQTYFQNT
jgi:transposase-like protein